MLGGDKYRDGHDNTGLLQRLIAAVLMMSSKTREKLANDPRLVLQNKDSQRDDLLDSNKTNTWLIEFLVKLLDTAKHPILVTALNSDHRPGTLHEKGRAVDCWHADWATVGDEKVADVMRAAAAIGMGGKPSLVEVGLSGDAARLKDSVKWPLSNVFVEDWGDENEHCHFAVGTP